VRGHGGWGNTQSIQVRQQWPRASLNASAELPDEDFAKSGAMSGLALFSVLNYSINALTQRRQGRLS
jgi:hypothetical protein